MSDTPHTDAAVVIIPIAQSPGGDIDLVEFVPVQKSRQLERALAASQAARRDEVSWWKERHDYKARAEKAEEDNAKLRQAVRTLLLAHYEVDPYERLAGMDEAVRQVEASVGSIAVDPHA